MQLPIHKPFVRVIVLALISAFNHLCLVFPAVFFSAYFIRKEGLFAYDGLYVTFNQTTQHLFLIPESFIVAPVTLLIAYFLNDEIEKTRKNTLPL